MENIFLGFLNRSIVAGWIILAIIVLRFLLKRAPKWLHCALWGMAAVRLTCPFSLESIFSLIPSREAVLPIMSASSSPAPLYHNSLPFAENVGNPMIRESVAAVPGAGGSLLQTWLFIGSILWIAGTCALLLYALASYTRLKFRVRTAVRLEGRIMLSEFIDTPFILGVFRPRIYLPSGMPEELRAPVAAHELAHLKRLDNLWKAIGYALLAVYWFHPLCWAAYLLLCRDIELACDEKVIKNYNTKQKRSYSEALLACSTERHITFSCPLAFGEVGVKERIRCILQYKKPAFCVMAIAVIACGAAALCFLTDPVRDDGAEKSPSTDATVVNGDTDNNDSGIVNNSAAGNDSAGNNNAAGKDGIDDDSPANGDDADGSPENDTDSGGKQAPTEDTAQTALQTAFVREWAAAFVSRDKTTLEGMIAEGSAVDALESLREQSDPEVSAPWPQDARNDVYLLNVGTDTAEIQYYAWTAEPHVTIWRETLSYELDNGKYKVTGEKLFRLDNISSGKEFELAYGSFPIDGSPMDYEKNGAGESLAYHALLSSTTLYLSLFEPKTAAIKLLNLSDDSSEVKIESLYSEIGLTNLEITFLKDEDGLPFRITMVQPYGEAGIWVPKNYRTDSVVSFLHIN